MKISWTALVRNEDVLSIKDVLIKRRSPQMGGQPRSQFFGHVLRKQELEHLVITGKINGKKTRGRQMENDGPNQSLDWSRNERGRDQKNKSETTNDHRCHLIRHTKKPFPGQLPNLDFKKVVG